MINTVIAFKDSLNGLKNTFLEACVDQTFTY